MEAVIIAIAAAFNMLIIKWKVEHSRYQDAALDVAILVILSALFSSTLGGMIIATISSFIASIYLLFSPPKFLSSIDTEHWKEEWKKRLPQ
jgi:multisubunit Na+/H+ antiporter MnhB subunit